MGTAPMIFDHALLDARRRRAFASGVPADFLYRAAGDELLDRLGAVNRRFGIAVDIGSPSAIVAERMISSGKSDRVVRLDRVVLARPDVVGDAELLPFGREAFDLAVSVLWLHWVNDLPGALVQIRRALRPDGLFLAALIGGESLSELREALAVAEADVAGGASPRIAPFADVRSVGALLQRAGFALPVVDLDRHTVRYDTALHVMHDLRAMGATNVLHERERRPLARAILKRAADVYAARFADPDGRIRATFDVLWLSGWAPHESQQQPMRPGSAKARLADAFGVTERSAGEKAQP